MKFKAVFALVFLLTSKAWALDVPAKPSGYVEDYTQSLSAQTKTQLETALSEFDRETSTQIFVVIFKSLEGQSLEDFSMRLAESWKPGQKDKNNGVILLVFKDDRQLRIEVGYGLEGVLPDALASQIIRNEIVPLFKQGEFDRGVVQGAGAIMKAVKKEYTAAPKKIDLINRMPGELILGWLLCYFIFPIIFYAGLIIFMIDGIGFHDGLISSLVFCVVLHIIRAVVISLFRLGNHKTYSRRGKSSPWSMWYNDTGSGSGGWSGSSFGGSSFGGGGGGSFGGGGASGRW